MKPAIWDHANDPKKWTANFLGNRDDRSPLLVQPERQPDNPISLVPVPLVKLPPLEDPQCWRKSVDSRTGRTLYWNELANVTSWDVPACLELVQQQQAKESETSELAAARKQLIAADHCADDHDRYFMAPPGMTPAAPAAKPAAKPNPTGPKLTPEEEKKQKQKDAFAKWQERQQATKKPRLMTASIKKAQGASAAEAVATVAKEKAETPSPSTEASGPALAGGRSAPTILQPKKPKAKKEPEVKGEGNTCHACGAFGYNMEEIVSEILGQTIVHHFCWDCVPGSEAAAKKARKRPVRIKGEGALAES